jgi:hypothetical protein
MRLWAMAGLAATACIMRPAASAARTFIPEQQGVDVAMFLTMDDARIGIFTSGNSVFDYSKWTGPFLKTTPPQIAADYDRNELSADDKYTDILTIFSGQISAIRKDSFGYPFITVETGSMFHEIQASMDNDTAALAKLSKGEKIDLVCKGASYVLMSPILHHCMLKDSFIAAEGQKAADAVAAWLNGGEVPSFLDSEKRRTEAFFIYFIGTKMQNPIVCKIGTGDIKACVKQSKSVDLKKLGFQSAVDAARIDLGLSPGPVQIPAPH